MNDDELLGSPIYLQKWLTGSPDVTSAATRKRTMVGQNILMGSVRAYGGKSLQNRIK